MSEARLTVTDDSGDVVLHGIREIRVSGGTLSGDKGGVADIDTSGGVGTSRWEILTDGLGNLVYVDNDLVYVFVPI